MPIEIERVPPNRGTGNPLKSNRIKWLGADVHRHFVISHSFNRILQHQLTSDVTTFGIEGREGTGKTTVSRLFAHWFHTEIDKVVRSNNCPEDIKSQLRLGYIVEKLGKQDLFPLKATLDRLPMKNRILIFDDVSFMKGSKSAAEIAKLKEEITTIRHAEGIDLRTIIIFNFHYSKGLDKYIRDTDFVLFTSIGREEIGNVENLLGRSNQKIIRRFHKARALMTTQGRAKVTEMTPHGTSTVVYQQNKPFRLGLFHDNFSTNFIAFPKFEMYAEPGKCTICYKKEKADVDVPYEPILNELAEFYGPNNLSTIMQYIVVKYLGENYIRGKPGHLLEAINRLATKGVDTIGLAQKYLDTHPNLHNLTGNNPAPKRATLSADFMKTMAEKFQIDLAR